MITGIEFRQNTLERATPGGDIRSRTADADGTIHAARDDGRGDWSAFPVGSFPEADWSDRCAAGDLNGDGRVDIVVTEENPGTVADAPARRWEQPAGGAMTAAIYPKRVD